MWTTRVLLAAVLVVGVASSADARRRHHGYYGSGEGSSGSNTLDQWRARQAQGQSGQPSRGEDRAQGRSSDRGSDRGDDRTSRRGQDAQDPQNAGQDRSLDRAQDLGQDRARYDRRRYRESGDWRRYRDYRDERRRAREEDRRRGPARDDVAPARAAGPAGDPALSGGRNGAFGATIDKLVRGCAAQAAEFANWPLDDIARTVAADENQRNALEALRGKAKAAGERLSADCPRDVPAAPAARLEAAEQGIAATLSALDTVEPALKAFYAALNDEQKARLYHDMAKPAAPAASNAADTKGRREAQDARRARRDYSSRRHRWRDGAAARKAPARDDAAQRRAAKPGWNGSCEALSAVLRNWPVGEIERDVRLTTAQRVAFYELVTSSLKAADTLATACPAEAALTPVGRMQAMRQRLTAVRAATAAIRPALTRFYDALDQGQQQRFAGMS
jgi:LTXXQ motif family protein